MELIIAASARSQQTRHVLSAAISANGIMSYIYPCNMSMDMYPPWRLHGCHPINLQANHGEPFTCPITNAVVSRFIA